MSLLKKYIFKNLFAIGFLVAILIYLVYLIRFILAIVFASFVLASALMPATKLLRRWKVPKVLAAFLPLLLLAIILITIFIPLGPLVSSQFQQLSQKIPELLDKAAGIFGARINTQEIFGFAAMNPSVVSQNIFLVGSKVVEVVASTLLLLFLSFFILFDNELIKESIVSLFPSASAKSKARFIYEDQEAKIGYWLSGQVILSVFVGAMFGVTYFFIGIPNALPLAILAGVFEIVPNIGPIAGAILGLLVALSVSTTDVLILAIAYIVIHFLEAYVLTPFIMQRAVGLHPIAIVLSIIIGTIYMGIIGALLAVPFLSFLVLIARDLKKNSKKNV